MQIRTLGSTNIQISSICLGTMTWGQQNSEADAHKQMDYAVSVGVNFFDTAELYPVPPVPERQGMTEEFIGSWIAKRGKRDDFIIASKVAPTNLLRYRDPGAQGEQLNEKNIRMALEGSLKRLQTDYIDLYQIHWPERRTNFFGIRGFERIDETPSTTIEETLSVMADLIKEGKIRAVGLSNETPWGVNEYLRLAREKKLPKIASIQNQYSLTNRTFEIGLSEISLHEDVPLLAYSTLAMGVLSGKYLDGARPAGGRFTVYENQDIFVRNQERYNHEFVQPAVKRYVNIARKYNIDPAAMAIAFAHSREFMGSVIIGATTIDQLKTDIAASELKLPDGVLSEIAEVYRAMPDPTV